jgi:cytoskeletal protein CcmA (bactofilin family)
MAQGRTASRSEGGARIGRGTRIRGRIAGEGDLTVEGAVEGDIALRGALVVAEGADVTSDVEATDVTVSGRLEGTVNASGQVRVLAGAKVKGDLSGTSGVSIEEGAEYAGRLDCEFDLPPELR